MKVCVGGCNRPQSNRFGDLRVARADRLSEYRPFRRNISDAHNGTKRNFPRQRRPAAVDLGCPDSNGHDFCRRDRSHGPSGLVCTADTGAILRVNADRLADTFDAARRDSNPGGAECHPFDVRIGGAVHRRNVVAPDRRQYCDRHTDDSRGSGDVHTASAEVGKPVVAGAVCVSSAGAGPLDPRVWLVSRRAGDYHLRAAGRASGGGKAAFAVVGKYRGNSGIVRTGRDDEYGHFPVGVVHGRMESGGVANFTAGGVMSELGFAWMAFLVLIFRLYINSALADRR